MQENYSFHDLVTIIEKLRSENGCPWDKIQTHETLKKCMLEEAYEAIDAIENNDMKNLMEELGDVLLQVVFHAQIETENHNFTIHDVIDAICKKMIFRHPHIFSDAKADTPEEVLANWDEIKKIEKHISNQTEVLKRIPKSLPALMRAQKVQAKAADVGFDFSNTLEALEKVEEEIAELKQALLYDKTRILEEFGDLLFSTVNLSRFLQLNAEFALTKATEKFINRFEYVEKSVLSQDKNFSDMAMDKLDVIWEQSKKCGY